MGSNNSNTTKHNIQITTRSQYNSISGVWHLVFPHNSRTLVAGSQRDLCAFHHPTSTHPPSQFLDPKHGLRSRSSYQSKPQSWLPLIRVSRRSQRVKSSPTMTRPSTLSMLWSSSLNSSEVSTPTVSSVLLLSNSAPSCLSSVVAMSLHKLNLEPERPPLSLSPFSKSSTPPSSSARL